MAPILWTNEFVDIWVSLKPWKNPLNKPTWSFRKPPLPQTREGFWDRMKCVHVFFFCRLPSSAAELPKTHPKNANIVIQVNKYLQMTMNIYDVCVANFLEWILVMVIVLFLLTQSHP